MSKIQKNKTTPVNQNNLNNQKTRSETLKKSFGKNDKKNQITVEENKEFKPREHPHAYKTPQDDDKEIHKSEIE